MKILNYKLMIASLAFGGLTFSTLADTKIAERIEDVNEPIIKIEHKKGDVMIESWSENSVEITGTIYDDFAELKVKRNGRVISVEIVNTNSKRGTVWHSGSNIPEADLKIKMPALSDIDFTSINGDISVDGVNGEIDIELINGETTVTNASGELDVVSVNGDVYAKNVSGRLNLETVNGSIEVTHAGNKDVKLGSVNGDIELISNSPDIVIASVNADMDLKLGDVDDLSIDMVNGAVDAKLALLPGGKLEASSVGGSLSFIFTKEVSSRVDVYAHAGGNIKNKLSDDKVEKQKYGPGRSLNFTTGEGDGRININTVSGRITLTKE